MENALKGVILQAMTKNSNVNAVTLQALQCITVAVALHQPAVQNGQNNEITTIHYTLPTCSMVEVV